jgi:RND family efflux transporter MFP subunit
METRASGIAWGRWGIVLVVAVAVAACLWYFLVRGSASAEEANDPGRDTRSGVKVQTAIPRAGGLPRKSVQPASTEPYVGAALFAKVSGRLKTLKVDIGDRVRAGDLLAEIEIPELEAQVARNKARVEDAEAKLKQAEAQKTEAEAEARAAESAVKLATIMIEAKTAFKDYRKQQLERIKALVAKNAEDEKVRDEQQSYYLSALEAENAARQQVNTEQERATAARVKILRVEADIRAARADIAVAEAELATSKVWVDYGQIRAPFNGVVTQRGYLQWDFIKAGEQGGNTPILTIASTDVMRVVVQVPDRDVPYVAPGKPAILTFDALPGVVYETEGNNKVVVSRLANAEDYETRLMRVEVDVRNKDGRLKPGMYGRATIVLADGSPSAVRIPSAALVGRGEEGKGTVHVVRDGKIQTVPIKYGTDNGIDVEILSGLSTQDQVVLAANVPLKDGTPVTVTSTDKGGP